MALMPTKYIYLTAEYKALHINSLFQPYLSYLSINTLCSLHIKRLLIPQSFLILCLRLDVRVWKSLPFSYPHSTQDTQTSACQTPTALPRLLLNATSSMKPFLISSCVFLKLFLIFCFNWFTCLSSHDITLWASEGLLVSAQLCISCHATTHHKETQMTITFYCYYLLIVKFTPHQLIFLLIQIQNPFHLSCFGDSHHSWVWRAFTLGAVWCWEDKCRSCVIHWPVVQSSPAQGATSCRQILAWYFRALSLLLVPFISFRRPPWVPQTFFPRHRPGMSVTMFVTQTCCFTRETLNAACFPNGGMSHWLL